MMKSHHLALALVVSLFLAPTGSADEIDRLTSAPATAGKIALLVNHRSDPRTLKAWQAALASDDAHLRAAAARAVAMSGMVGLLPSIRATTASEADQATMSELLRTLLILGTDADRNYVLDALPEQTAGVQADVLSHLAQVLGEGAAGLRESDLFNSLSAPDKKRFLRNAGLEKKADSSDGDEEDLFLESLAVQLIDYPPGLVVGVLKASGCNALPRDLAAGTISYRRNGGKRVELDRWSPRTESCREAASTLFLLSLPPEGRPLTNEATAQSVVVFFDEKVAACADRYRERKWNEDGSSTTLRIGGDVSPPKPTRKAKPRYPEVAKAAKIKGLVILEATVTEEGCVAAVRALRGPRALVIEAMATMSQWQFKPATRNGEPVDVYFTLTINFTLK